MAASARTAALALLSRRDYTAAELKSKLDDKGYDANQIEQALADLRASRIVDDRRVAMSHVRTATTVKGRGRIRIARELAARGIDKDTIAEAMQGVGADHEAVAIRKILTRKRWVGRSASLKERQKMFRHLMARGYPGDAISKALGGSVEDEDTDN